MSGKAGMFKGKRKGAIPQVVIWTAADCRVLLEMWERGAEISEMREAFSRYGEISRNIIYGKIWRLRRALGVDEDGNHIVRIKNWSNVGPRRQRIVNEVRVPQEQRVQRESQEIDLRGVPKRLAGNSLGLFSGDFGPNT